MASVLADPRDKRGYMASGKNRGQKGYLLASPQYASVPDPRQNEENNQGKKPLLHWCTKVLTTKRNWSLNISYQDLFSTQGIGF